MWSGVGLSRIPCVHIRRGAAAAALAVSLVSLIPYHTAWQKTDAAIAFRSLPPPGEQGAVLLDRAYAAPVAFYYLGSDAKVWGLKANEGSDFALVQISYNGSLPENFQPADCSVPAFQGVTNVWIYGPTERIRKEQERWPSCLTEKSLWVFENCKWTSLSH